MELCGNTSINPTVIYFAILGSSYFPAGSGVLSLTISLASSEDSRKKESGRIGIPA
jgi:hypothetical protein